MFRKVSVNMLKVFLLICIEASCTGKGAGRTEGDGWWVIIKLNNDFFYWMSDWKSKPGQIPTDQTFNISGLIV